MSNNSNIIMALATVTAFEDAARALVQHERQFAHEFAQSSSWLNNYVLLHKQLALASARKRVLEILADNDNSMATGMGLEVFCTHSDFSPALLREAIKSLLIDGLICPHPRRELAARGYYHIANLDDKDANAEANAEADATGRLRRH
jgi:hypothetical protein